VRLAKGSFAGRDERPQTTKLYEGIGGPENRRLPAETEGAGLTTVGSYLRNADLSRGGTNYAAHFKGSRA
jgi:hypothetical protein